MENSFTIIEKLNIINTRKKAKKNFTFDFSTLYITIPYNLLIKVLQKIKVLSHFVFKLKGCSKIAFSESKIVILLSEIWCSSKVLESL